MNNNFRVNFEFDQICMSLEYRKNTCPECRSKTIQSKLIRVYPNIVDLSCMDVEVGPENIVTLQNENDNLKFQLIEKDSAIKSKIESISRLQDENKKLTTNATQSRSIILSLEQKIETNKIITIQHTDQVSLSTRSTCFTHLDVFGYISKIICSMTYS